MFKKNKAMKSEEAIEKGLYTKVFLKAFGLGFAANTINVKNLAANIIGSAVLNNGDLANGEFESTLKTAGLVTIGSGVLSGVVSGVKGVQYLKNAIAEMPDDATEIEVVFEED